MKKKKSPKFTAVLASIFATFAVYTGALAIFLYVQGWRFDFAEQSLKQVGVLTVESSPTLADIYVDGKHKGRTNKSMTLDIGTYEVIISKEGYYDWKKEVKILEEKSTPVFPYLILTEFPSEVVYKSDLPLLKHWEDRTNNHLLLLLEEENSLRLVHYDINTGFWSLNTTPTDILTIPTDQEENPITDIQLQLSPTGEKAVLTTITAESSSKYIVPTTRTSSYSTIIESPLALEGFANYEIIWSNDEDYLILESETDVVSYNLNRDTKSLLFRKVDDLDVWDSDSDGYFYILDHIKANEDGILEYTLRQYNMDGSSEITVLPAIYFQNNLEYIENYRTTDFNFGYFTNSPENTQTIGEVKDFEVNQDVNGLFIKTSQASYWYDSDLEKYITISPFPADLVEVSPDGDKLLVETPTEYRMFVFDKEEGDHTIAIGTHDIENLNSELVEKINWLSNSSYFQFEEDEFIYLSDKDGENKTPLLNNENILYWTVTKSRDNLITLTNTEEDGVLITSYTIH